MITATISKELVTADGKGELRVELSLEKGIITSLYGDSGVGKTMLLRMIAGLETPGSGHIKYEEQTWYDSSGRTMAIEKRGVGFVFQDYGLFPNMTVEQNIRFACAEDDAELIHYYLETFGLETLKDRKPTELSGGQKQRTAIARALAFKPKVLLLDEPFTAQDKRMSDIVGKEILKYTKEQDCVTVMVTHNLAMTFQLATYIYSIGNGEVINKGTVEEVFLRDASEQGNGLNGVVAELIDKNGKLTCLILVNEQLIEIHAGEVPDVKVGDEVYLKFDQEASTFQLEKL